MSDLKARQAASEQVEKKMLDFLTNFTPAEQLSVGDAKCIARFARNFAFDAFDFEKAEGAQ